MAENHQEALLELNDATGTAFDPAVVKAFVEAIIPGSLIHPVAQVKTTVKKRGKTTAKKATKKNEVLPESVLQEDTLPKVSIG